MTVYAFALFLHIIGVVLLFVAFTTEGIAVFELRRATTIAHVQTWQGITGLARVFGPASVVAIVSSGLYMTIDQWGWAAWIAVGMLTWVAIAVMGAVNGIRLNFVIARAADDASRIRELRARSFAISWFTRLTLGVGVVFLMTNKPELVPALFCVVIAAAVGAGVGMIATRETPQPRTT